jgi:hypothetical protein
MQPDEPWAARLHFVARATRRPQEALVSLFRRDVERSRHWVLLTTRGGRPASRARCCCPVRATGLACS